MPAKEITVRISRVAGGVEEVDATMTNHYVRFKEPIAMLNGDALILPVAHIMSLMLGDEELSSDVAIPFDRATNFNSGDAVSLPPMLDGPIYKRYGVNPGESEPMKALAIVMLVSFGSLLAIALFVYLMSTI